MVVTAGNIVLIGMPGVGKSTLGVLLAKVTGRNFLDTDVYIQAREERTLRDIIERDGLARFRAIEERSVLTLQCRNTVIATGGSVVYGTAAMEHLGATGRVVHLFLPLNRLRSRLTDFEARGVVRAPGQSLDSLFEERAPLYQRYAEVAVDCAGKTHEEIVVELARVACGKAE